MKYVQWSMNNDSLITNNEQCAMTIKNEQWRISNENWAIYNV